MKRGVEEGSRRERRNEMPGGGPRTAADPTRTNRPAENRPKGRREGFLIWSFAFLPRLEEEEERGR